MISVVIPLYNGSETILDSIESVLLQTRIDLIEEIVIVDDGSTDQSVQLIKEKYSNNSLIRLIHKENGGVSSARNYGIECAKGEWIALLDSDDVWKSEKIEAQWNKIQGYREIKFIGTNRNKENYHGGKRIDDTLYRLSLRNELFKTWPHTSTALIKKEVFDSVGLFNESMKYAEDGEMWNRIALHYDLYYIPVSYEIAGGNKKPYGESGLSANLEEMYIGTIRNIRLLKDQRHISLFLYYVLRIFYCIKHIRRKILCRRYGRNK